MTVYVAETGGEWTTVDVRGATMRKRNVFEGDYGVRSAFYEMPAGLRIPPHHHSKWVQVTVLKGRMRVEQDGKPERLVGAGGVYFVLADESHVETAIDDTLLLVTQGEDRPGWGGAAPSGDARP